MSKAWYALYSHTGTELVSLIKGLSVKPKIIFTDNLNTTSMCSLMHCGVEVRWCNLEGTLKQLQHCAKPNSVITLHGYMRIIPSWFIQWCAENSIKLLNVHPAPIQMYPELKGADPQHRLYQGAIEGRYEYFGIVIHEVSTELDGGPIICAKTMRVPVCYKYTLSDVDAILRHLSFQAWRELIEGGLFTDGANH